MNLFHSKLLRLSFSHIVLRLDMLRCLLIVSVAVLIKSHLCISHDSNVSSEPTLKNPAQTFRQSLTLKFHPHSVFHATPSLFKSKEQVFNSQVLMSIILTLTNYVAYYFNVRYLTGSLMASLWIGGR